MRKQTNALFLAFAAAAVLAIGCKPSDSKKAEEPKAEEPAAESSESTETAVQLNIDSDASPEGVTNHFFTAFFSGKDDEAWSLLTADAQTMTEETFAAQANDTIRWKVTDVKKEGENAYVFINVSDLNDKGDRASEEMIFALRNEENRWGVAGFSTGEVIVNFEEKALESVHPTAAGEQEPTRVGQKMSDSETLQ